MGRPWLHHTADAKRKANRAKSARSYLRHRSDILLARREKRRQSQDSGHAVAVPKNTALVPEVTAPTDPSKPEYWAYQADGRHTQLRIHLHACSKSYVEAAAQDYLRTNKTESLSDRIKDLEKFRTYFRTCEAHLLQLDGVSERWRKVQGMTLEVGEIICWMEQLLCNAMMGILIFQAGYLVKGFAYQRE